MAPLSAATPVLVIIGPSGSGKSSMVRELHRRRVVRVHPTWTTRPRRHDELDGTLEHRFVSDAAFDELCARQFFLDTVALFGLPYRYGLPPLPEPTATTTDAVMLRAPLVDRFAPFAPRRIVYQIEDTEARAGHRLCERGGSAADVAARLADNRRELDAGRQVADRVFVNDGSLAELADAVAATLAGDLR